MAGTTTAKIFPYPLNTWYVAGWDHEVNRSILARTVAGIAGAPQDGSPGTGQPNLVPTDTTSAPQQAPTSTPAPVP